MKTINRFISITTFLMIFEMKPCLGGPSKDEIDWPVAIENAILQVLDIKKRAMSFPAMRTENGKLGEEMEEVIDKLGALLTDNALIQRIHSSENTDIRAKIASWALDRKRRPKEYRRFAMYYVNKPTLDDAAAYFYRPYQELQNDPFALKKEPNEYIPRPGAWIPNPVSQEDQVDENRSIIEYCFFMPPTGNAFDRDCYRERFSDVLFSFSNIERSMIVMIKDAEVAISTVVNREKFPWFKGNEDAPLNFIVYAGTDISFCTLSRFWKTISAREKIKTIFSRMWPTGRLEVDYSVAKKRYDAWQTLAKREWSQSEEHELANWLLALPAPKAPPPPRPEDPKDPFGSS